MPERIQIRRDRPWQTDPKAIKVDRTTKWGNPFHAGKSVTRADAVMMFMVHALDIAPFTTEQIRDELGGRDLACWCPLDDTCHGDVLLAIANPAVSTQSEETP